MWPFSDEHLFDELETVDNDARRRTQSDAENVTVNSTELRESFKWNFVLSQQVERADEWPTDRAGRWTPWPLLGNNCATLTIVGRRRCGRS